MADKDVYHPQHLKRKKSLRDRLHITWDHDQTENHLYSRLAPSTILPDPLSHPQSQTGQTFPEIVTTTDIVLIANPPIPRKRKSWFNLRHRQAHIPVRRPSEQEQTGDGSEGEEEEDMWQHHSSYFPTYESFLEPVETTPGPAIAVAQPMPIMMKTVPDGHSWNTGSKLKKGKVQFVPGANDEPYLPTPEPTPEKAIHTKKGIANKGGAPACPDSYALQPMQPTHTTLAHITDSGTGGTSWTPHASYFPEYTPIFPKTHTALATTYGLSPAEVAALNHSKTLGHAVSIHYPDLPSWEQYGKTIPKGKTGWTSTKWGTDGEWTGYGYDGATLPNAEGHTFGVGMPKGEVLKAPGGGGGQPGQGKKNKNKNKNKQGGGQSQNQDEGEGGEGDGDGNDGEENQGDDDE